MPKVRVRGKTRRLTVGKELKGVLKANGINIPKTKKPRVSKPKAKNAAVKKTWSEKRFEKSMKNLQNKTNAMKMNKKLMDAKLEHATAKRDYNRVMTDINSERGGPIGAWNRHKKEVQAKSNKKIKMYEMEPELSAAERKTKMQTDATVKKWSAAGRAVSVAGSAIAAGYARGKKYDSEAAQARAEADKESAEALRDSFNVLDGSGNSDKSVSGLITGVR